LTTLSLLGYISFGAFVLFVVVETSTVLVVQCVVGKVSTVLEVVGMLGLTTLANMFDLRCP
jgi:hypothetical protein